MRKSRFVLRTRTVCVALLSSWITSANVSSAETARPLFFEDFESGTLSKSVWIQAVTGENLIEVQNDKVAHGKFALRVRCPAPSNKTWAFVIAEHLPELLRKHHFGRAYVFVTPKPPARHTILIMAGTPGFPKNKFQEVATTNGKWQLTYVDLQPDGDREDLPHR